MPYIAKEERLKLYPFVQALADAIEELPAGVDNPIAAHAGRLNYAVTALALLLMGKPKYWKIALFCGVFTNIKDEFYRKLAAPYEDKKIAENGDVYL